MHARPTAALALLAIPALAASLLATPAFAADKVKIGFISTFSGPGGVVGKHMKDGANLALEQLGGKVGDLPAEIVFRDDTQKPDIGLQAAQELLEKDKVDFITGVIWSNVLLAIYNPVIKSGTILISANAGPHEVAGAQCSPYFFSTSWQNDETPEAMGKYMNDQKLEDVYLLAPNYAAGKDMVAGFKRYFKGKIVGELYTKMGQADYQAEISQIRAANPKAVFVFYPGGMGIQFVKQYAQAGLRETVPLYSSFTSDETTLPAQQDAALGNYESGSWSPGIDVPAAQAFTDAFKKKYNYLPSYYAQQSYDAILLIDSAVRAVKGDLSDKKGMIAEMEKADFKSARGPFKYNINHIPIENFYLFKVAKDADGNYYRKQDSIVFSDHKDAYYEECKPQ
jgi:branched-chain amino acid transport system substrate-binding protein